MQSGLMLDFDCSWSLGESGVPVWVKLYCELRICGLVAMQVGTRACCPRTLIFF
jgi:hypothetical protein